MKKSIGKSLSVTCTIVVFLTTAYYMIRYMKHMAREGGCAGNLAFIGLALQNYHAGYGCFPPAMISDKDGKPMHSWRILILPQLGGKHGMEIYKRYNFSEPWNGPSNRKLANMIPSIFRCPNQAAYQPGSVSTNYVAVVGRRTAFPGTETSGIGQARGCMMTSVLLVENCDSIINWMEPRDLDFDHMDFHVNGRVKPSISSLDPWGAAILLVDGRVRRLDTNVLPRCVRSMISVDCDQKSSDCTSYILSR
jgi:hypothetical protein